MQWSAASRIRCGYALIQLEAFVSFLKWYKVHLVEAINESVDPSTRLLSFSIIFCGSFRVFRELSFYLLFVYLMVVPIAGYSPR